MLVVSSKAQRNRGDRASRIRPKTADDRTVMPAETPHMLILSRQITTTTASRLMSQAAAAASAVKQIRGGGSKSHGFQQLLRTAFEPFLIQLVIMGVRRLLSPVSRDSFNFPPLQPRLLLVACTIFCLRAREFRTHRCCTCRHRGPYI